MAERFRIPSRPACLSDEAYYEFVEDGFRLLCEKAEVWPCMIDAAIFVSFDQEAYSEDIMRWWRAAKSPGPRQRLARNSEIRVLSRG
jgi:hypothetical protein